MSEKEEIKQSSAQVFFNGLVKENPTFVLTLGMCPTLAVTTSAVNGLGMGLTTTAVLVLSNMIISLLRHIIPDKVRIPAFIVIIASFVTVMQLLLQGFIPSLYDSLGIYIPLIVVNCIILGRAEAFASKNPVIPSFFDGLGMGLGFTVALTCIGAVRELLGAGEIFGLQWNQSCTCSSRNQSSGRICTYCYLYHGTWCILRTGYPDSNSEPCEEKDGRERTEC